MKFRYLFFLGVILFGSCKKDDDKQDPVFSIADFTLKNGMIGDTLMITGNVFGTDAEAISVQVGNSAPVKPYAVKDIEIRVVIPEDASSGKIKLTKADGSSVMSSADFTLDPQAYNKIAFTGTLELSVARSGFAAAGLKGKIVFLGGEASGDHAVAEIYDVKTGLLSSVQLNSPSRDHLAAAAAGNKIVFAGGEAEEISDAVDIYDVTTGQWTTAKLSEPRYRLAAAAAGNKVVFAGGAKPDADGSGGVESARVDIYDVTTGQWTTAQLSVARRRLTATAAGNKILFGGGYGVDGNDPNTVDIYDVTTGQWSVSRLSSGKTHLAAAGAGNIAIFAGGSVDNGTVKTADIYNSATGQWTTANLSVAREDLAAAAFPNKIVFAGGSDADGKDSKVVDVYDIKTGAWSALQLSVARSLLAGAAAGNKLLFAGGDTEGGESRRIDVFTLSK